MTNDSDVDEEREARVCYMEWLPSHGGEARGGPGGEARSATWSGWRCCTGRESRASQTRQAQEARLQSCSKAACQTDHVGGKKLQHVDVR